MDAPLLIIGQGLAGSMLGWACEQAGVAFRIVDRGHDTAASRVGAGLVSPLTGRRLVPTWRFAEWRDEVVAIYRELERELGVPLLREVRFIASRGMRRSEGASTSAAGCRRWQRGSRRPMR